MEEGVRLKHLPIGDFDVVVLEGSDSDRPIVWQSKALPALTEMGVRWTRGNTCPTVIA